MNVDPGFVGRFHVDLLSRGEDLMDIHTVGAQWRSGTGGPIRTIVTDREFRDETKGSDVSLRLGGLKSAVDGVEVPLGSFVNHSYWDREDGDGGTFGFPGRTPDYWVLVGATSQYPRTPQVACRDPVRCDRLDPSPLTVPRWTLPHLVPHLRG